MLDEGLTWIPIYGWCSRRSLLTLGESTNDAQGRILWRSRRGPRSQESSIRGRTPGSSRKSPLTLEEGPVTRRRAIFREGPLTLDSKPWEAHYRSGKGPETFSVDAEWRGPVTLKAGPYKAQEWGRDVRGGPPWRSKEESHELGVMCRYMSLCV